jgi:hypothetical protein
MKLKKLVLDKEDIPMFKIWYPIASRTKCFWCKTEFDKPLFTVKGNFNMNQFGHFKHTHGLPYTVVLGFIQRQFLEYPETESFFKRFELIFEKIEY